MSNVASTLLPFLATMSKQRSTLLPKTATISNEFCVEISSFRQSQTLLRHCCPKRQHCRSNRQQSCLLLRQCCFDIVASVDRTLVLTNVFWTTTNYMTFNGRQNTVGLILSGSFFFFLATGNIHRRWVTLLDSPGFILWTQHVVGLSRLNYILIQLLIGLDVELLSLNPSTILLSQIATLLRRPHTSGIIVFIRR